MVMCVCACACASPLRDNRHSTSVLITGGCHNGHVYYTVCCHGDGSVEGHNVHQVSQQHSHNPLYVGNSEYCLSISEYVPW